MWPWLLRPPLEDLGSISERSGSVAVISALSCTVRNRELGVTGLNFLTPMGPLGLQVLVHFDRITLGEGDDGLLPVRPAARETAHRVDLPHPVLGADVQHLDLEQLLDRVGDLPLVRARVHGEHELVRPLLLAGRLLREERPQDDAPAIHWRPLRLLPRSRQGRDATPMPRPPPPPRRGAGRRATRRRRTF